MKYQQFILVLLLPVVINKYTTYFIVYFDIL